MDIQKIFDKRLKRKNFFYSLGTGIAGYAVMKTFPFNFIGKRFFNDRKEQQKVLVKINPLAVSRQKIGGNNGRS